MTNQKSKPIENANEYNFWLEFHEIQVKLFHFFSIYLFRLMQNTWLFTRKWFNFHCKTFSITHCCPFCNEIPFRFEHCDTLKTKSNSLVSCVTKYTQQNYSFLSLYCEQSRTTENVFGKNIGRLVCKFSLVVVFPISAMVCIQWCWHLSTRVTKRYTLCSH